MKVTITYTTAVNITATVTNIKYCKARDLVFFETEEGFIKIEKLADIAIFLKMYYPDILEKILKIRKSL